MGHNGGQPKVQRKTANWAESLTVGRAKTMEKTSQKLTEQEITKKTRIIPQ